MDPTYQDFLSEDPQRPGVLRFGGARMALLDVGAGFWGLRRQMEALVGPRLTDAVLQQAGVNGGASFARAFAPDVSPQTAAQALRDCIAAYQAAGFGRFQIEVLEWPVGRVVVRAWDAFEAWMMRQHGRQAERPVCAYSAGVLVGFVNVLAGRNDVVCIQHACQAQGADSCLFELLPAEAAGDVPVVALAPDPALGRQLNLLEILLDKMPMGIAIFDRDLRLRRCNPTWAGFIDRYTPSSASQVVPGARFFDLAPGTEEEAMPIFERVLSGETVRLEGLRLESGGIASYWDVVFAPLIEDGEVVGFVDVTTDATERVRTEQALRESEAHFRSLLENATNFAVYRLAVDPDNPYGARVVMVSPSIKEITGVSEPYRFESWFENVHPEDLPKAVEANRRAVERGEPYSQPVRVYHPQKQQWIWVHTASTPVFDAEGRLTYFNGLIIDITEQKRAEEALQLAYQTLEQRVEERTRELQTLLDVVATASRSLNLDEMLAQTLDRLVALVGASRVGVMLVDSDSGELRPGMIRPERSIAPEDLAEVVQACHDVIARGKPLYVPVDEARGHVEPGALLPLRARGEALGVLVIVGPEGGAFSQGQMALFESIADQLGVAVENARLYEQAEQAAAAAERSRLARDLHDAVTQTLFSTSLIAEVLPRIWERDPEEGQRRLEELRELTRGALAEMRTLLLELRPAALAEARLGDLLRQLAESITGRARVPVAVEVEGERPLPPEVKIALYRIAQEALNNVAKHAGARRAEVRLRCEPGRVEMCVCDDGSGFDLASVPPESLGLGIMRERAEAVGAALEIESRPGEGTQVIVTWVERETSDVRRQEWKERERGRL